MARRRVLQPEEKELWLAVARTARALHGKSPPVGDGPATFVAPKAPDPPKPKLPQFHIGERSRITLPSNLPAPALLMDAKTYGKMSRGKIAPDTRIDLHGMTLAEAHPELIRFVLDAKAAGHRLLLVITGKGSRGADIGPIPQRTGALRHQVPLWLRLPPLGHAVLQITEANQRHGGSGAFYVYLRKG